MALTQNNSFRSASASRFRQRCQASGRVLNLQYFGVWARDCYTGNVSQFPSANAATNPAQCYAMLGANSITFADVLEKTRKWGQNFMPDMVALVPINIPVSDLYAVTDSDGQFYQVIMVAADATVESICHTLILRRQAIWNKNQSVSVSQDSQLDDSAITVFANLPCRIVYATDSRSEDAAMGNLPFGLGDTPAAAPMIETPLIWESTGSANGAIGANVQPFPGLVYPLTAGSSPTVASPGPWYLQPKGMTIRDTSSGQTLVYRISSPNMDRGGENHHNRYQLSLATDM